MAATRALPASTTMATPGTTCTVLERQDLHGGAERVGWLLKPVKIRLKRARLLPNRPSSLEEPVGENNEYKNNNDSKYKTQTLTDKETITK